MGERRAVLWGVGATLLVLACQLGWLWVDGRPPEADAGQWHLPNLRHLLGEGPANPSREYYPPLGYWSALPLAWLARELHGGWSDDFAAAAMLLAWTPVLAWSAWRLGGLPALVPTLTAPGVLAYGREYYLEYPAAATVLWATAELSEERPRPAWLALALLACALVKWSFPFYLAGALLWAGWRWRRDPGPALGAALLAAALAWAWYGGAPEGTARWRTVLGGFAGQPDQGPAPWDLTLVAAAVMLPWPWLVPAALALGSRRAWPLLAQAALALGLLMTASNPDARYVMPVVPLVTCAAGAACRDMPGLRRVLAGTAALGLLACAGWVGWLQAGGSGEWASPLPLTAWAKRQEYGRLSGRVGGRAAGEVGPGLHSVLGATPEP